MCSHRDTGLATGRTPAHERAHPTTQLASRPRQRTFCRERVLRPAASCGGRHPEAKNLSILLFQYGIDFGIARARPPTGHLKRARHSLAHMHISNFGQAQRLATRSPRNNPRKRRRQLAQTNPKRVRTPAQQIEPYDSLATTHGRSSNVFKCIEIDSRTFCRAVPDVLPREGISHSKKCLLNFEFKSQ